MKSITYHVLKAYFTHKFLRPPKFKKDDFQMGALFNGRFRALPERFSPP